MRILKLILVLWMFAGLPTTVVGQGLPIADLKCETVVNGIRSVGQVHISLFSYGGVELGGAAQRQQIKIMTLRGQGHEIPGTLNLIGVFNFGGARLDIDVMLTGGNVGTGQYWFNGMSHRATIVQVQLVPGGFVTQDENGVRAMFNCQ